MDEGRRSKAEALFAEALERPAELRREFVQERCGSDGALREEVLSLLRYAKDEPQDEFAGWVRGEASALVDELEQPRLNPGDRVGAYRIEETIGRGGMGEVYRAARADGAFDKQVAIKVHLRGPLRAEETARFLRERQILAGLDHPALARLIDGDLLPDGTPYLVMDYVDGSPIDEYCRQNEMSNRSRLKLFLQVCSAIEHAHRNLVVHRDLKPSNLLVTEEGAVKVLDFGIAGLLDEGSGGEKGLTVSYAGPEQLGGARSTQATDVYSLGVVLYELLTGERPFRFESDEPESAKQLISSTTPFPPSTRTTVRPECAKLGRDIDAIVLKALEADPARRYASVEALREDIQRYFRNLPVHARPASLPHRAGLFVRRNSIAVGVAAAALLLLTATIGIYTARLQAQRNLALREAEAARQISEFLTDVFDATGPGTSGGEDVTARELLDRSVEAIRGDTVREPTVRSRMLRTMATAYRGLALPDEAEALAREAVTLMEEAGETGTAEYLAALNELAGVLAYRSKHPEAIELIERVIEGTKALDGGATPTLAHSWVQLGELLYQEAEFSRALELNEAALEVYRQHYAEDHVRVLRASLGVGKCLIRLERLDRAEALLQENLERSRRAHGERSVPASQALQQLARLAADRGDHETAAERWREHLATVEALHPPEHNIVSISRNNFALSLEELGRFDEAEALYRNAIDAIAASLGPDDLLLSRFRGNLAALQMRTGRGEAALQTYEEIYRFRQRVQGDDHFDTIVALHNLTYSAYGCGLLTRADEYDELSLEAWKNKVGTSHRFYGIALGNRGRLLRGLDRMDEARRSLEAAVETLTAAVGADHPETAKNRYSLAEVLAEMGAAGEAAQLLESEDSNPARVEEIRGVLAHRAERFDVAATHFVRSIELLRTEAEPDARVEIELLARLAESRRRAGAEREAEATAREAIAAAAETPLPNDLALADASMTLAQLLDPASEERAAALERCRTIYAAGLPEAHPKRIAAQALP